MEADKGGLLGASAYATSLLRQVGDDQTQVTTTPPPPGYATTFGQTLWTPTAEVAFFRDLALGCVLPPIDTDYELDLMRNVEPSESFGLGSAGFPQVAFKGGWGPEPGDQYGVRQTGIIGSGDYGIVVSITADPVSTFTVGQSVLDQVAQWLRREVRATPTVAAAKASDWTGPPGIAGFAGSAGRAQSVCANGVFGWPAMAGRNLRQTTTLDIWRPV